MRKLLLVFAVFSINTLHAQVSITTNTGTYSQDFNGLNSSGTSTWTDNSTIANWYAQRTGSGTSIIAGTGSSTTGGLYSFGTSGNADRAIGSLGSGNASAGDFAWGVQLKNNTSNNIYINNISYTGEQWRNGGSGSAQTVSFYYHISTSTNLDPGVYTSWIANTSLDFSSPVSSASSAALNGNLAANQTSFNVTTSILLAPGETLMMKWDDIDHPSSDDALALDNFSFTWTNVVPTPITLTDFFAETRGDVNILHWQTSMEQNNKGFNVLHASDGKHFRNIGFVASNAKDGNSETMTDYQFEQKLCEGKNYYKIQQVDMDNSICESKVIVVTNKNMIHQAVYPNPVFGSEIYLSKALEIEQPISIYNVMGQMVLSTSLIGNKLDISSLSQGNYTIYFRETSERIVFIKM